MEDQQKPTKTIALNYGLFLGIISILISVANYAMGKAYEQDWKIGLLSFIVMAVIITLGIKKFREANGGFLSLGQGLKTGIGIALIAAVIGIIYNMIFMNFIEPDFMEKMMEVTRENLLDNPNLSEEMIDQQMEIVKKMSSPAINAGIALIASVFFGFIISMVASLVMKKSDEEITSI